MYHQQPVSTMTWEGTMLSGQQAIVEKLGQLPAVRHQTNNMDVQPSTSNSAMIIFVQGKMQVRFLYSQWYIYPLALTHVSFCIGFRLKRTHRSTLRKCSSSSPTRRARSTSTTMSSVCSTVRRGVQPV
jgi:hypothetical protein